MIKIDNLNKYYLKGKPNENHVINNISITLPDTGLVSFLGPSGCGKTTLLNVIGGLDKATGTISYDDLTINKYDSKIIDTFRKKNISYIFQNYLLLPDLTIYDNLKLALEIMGIMDKDEVDKRIAYTLNAVGMYKYRKKLAKALSGGQQQRVAIARALLKNAKIILADEPTGNLDRANSIEVMNILKKISEKTLVLLVTHSKELAEFYSDRILLLSDGKITGEKTGDLDSLEHNSDNTIYLKDLDYKTIKQDDLNINLYEDKKTKASIRIISKNGRLYIDSNLDIELIDNHIKVLDKHFEALKKEEITEFNYDTSWYRNDLENERESFWSIFKCSVKNIFIGKRKSKFFNLLFVLIGLLFATTAIILTNVINTDVNFSYIENKYKVEFKNGQKDDLRAKLNEAYDKEYISEFAGITSNNYYINYSYTELSSKNFNFYSEVLPSNYLDADEMSYGKAPGLNEATITRGLADQIKQVFNIKDDSKLIGLKIKEMYGDTDGTTNKIVGISKNKGEAIYLSPNSGAFNYTVKPNQYANNYFSKDDISYELVEGSEISTDNQVLAFLNSGYRLNDIIEVMEYADLANGKTNKIAKTYKVVGLARVNKYSDLKAGLIFNDTESLQKIVKESVGFLPKSLGSYEVIKGRDIINPNECLASVVSDYNINDVYRGKKVVGLYRAEARSFGNSLILSDKEFNRKIVTNEDVEATDSLEYLSFNIDNMEGFKSLLKDYHFDTIYNLRLKDNRTDKIESSIVYISVAAILLIISIIYVYFIMRSKLIASIYPTAVIRNIGASKKFIYRRFLIDLLALTIFTNLLGYLGGYLIYYAFIYTIKGVLNVSVFASNIGIFLLGIALIFLVNFIIGILPIRRYLKDTPSEATSKYDI